MNRSVVAVIGASLVVVVVVVVILLFGVIPLPSYPSLAEHPDARIRGTIAFTHRPDGGRDCLYTVPARGGREREVICAEDTGIEGAFAQGRVAWTPQGDILVLSYGERGPVVLVVDPSSKEITDRIEVDTSRSVAGPGTKPVGTPEEIFFEAESDRGVRGGAQLLAGRTRDRATVSIRTGGGRVRTLLRARGPRDYRFDQPQWSPAGRWVAVRDSEARLIVLSADGAPTPRLLAEDVGGAAWFVPHDRSYTVDVGQLRRPAP